MKRSSLMAGWSLWILNSWLLGVLLSLTVGGALVCAAEVSSPAAVDSPGKITLQDGKLTARVVAAPLWRVMEEVSRLSGAQVRWLSQEGEEPVSVEFTALPLPEALRRILCEKNFMLFYASVGGEKRLAQVWISSGGKEGGQPVLMPPANNPALQVRETASQGRDEPNSVPLNMITQTVLDDENPASRLELIELLATQAGEDPQARALLSHIAHSDSDPHVQDTASAMLAGIE